jgi:hypothetical protein
MLEVSLPDTRCACLLGGDGRIRGTEGADARRQPCASAIERVKVKVGETGGERRRGVKCGKRSSRRRQHAYECPASAPECKGVPADYFWVSAGLAAGLGQKARPEERNTTSTTAIAAITGIVLVNIFAFAAGLSIDFDR